jgi:hypothetical protein
MGLHVREYETGATRDNNDDKLAYEGFLNPLVLKRFAEYMHEHRKQADGKLRAADNWQKGIPEADYIDSMWRHFMDVWMFRRGYSIEVTYEDALCAVIFNAMGLLHERLKLMGRDGPVLLTNASTQTGGYYEDHHVEGMEAHPGYARCGCLGKFCADEEDDIDMDGRC